MSFISILASLRGLENAPLCFGFCLCPIWELIFNFPSFNMGCKSTAGQAWSIQSSTTRFTNKFYTDAIRVLNN